MEKHVIQKVVREVRRRKLHVASTEYLTPAMLRIVFQSEELDGFDSPSPDDHVKVFLPQRGEEQPVNRDFTPRAWDLAAGTLTLDFVLHESGPAMEWARAAKPGDMLEIGGPRGSTMVPDDFDWYLLIGDATALPSFSRRLETLRSKVPVHVVASVAASERQSFRTDADCHVNWLDRQPSSLEDVLKFRLELDGFTLPAGDGFVWIAAETHVSRELYRYLVEERGHPAHWVKASAYWTETAK